MSLKSTKSQITLFLRFQIKMIKNHSPLNVPGTQQHYRKCRAASRSGLTSSGSRTLPKTEQKIMTDYLILKIQMRGNKKSEKEKPPNQDSEDKKQTQILITATLKVIRSPPRHFKPDQSQNKREVCRLVIALLSHLKIFKIVILNTNLINNK